MISLEALQKNVSDASFENIKKWLQEPKYSLYRAELEELIAAEKWQDLEDAFFKVIEFGTGGRRGTTGIGSNRINKVTIGESAQALCQYAQNIDPDAPSKGVAIAYDTRLTGLELSRFTAEVCAANGFKTYIFDGFRSTPELSFAVRELGCSVGIVISASHNPPADNGFKAYWSDGGQLVPPHDAGVLAKAEEITEIHAIAYDQALQEGKIIEIGEAIDSAYVGAAAAQAEGETRDIAIVYSPLHGAGSCNTLPVLRHAGFKNISEVKEQMVPDGSFPTIENGKPNPEERAANDRAVAQLLAENADIAITNDPDADRIGVIVRQGEEPFYLNGNQSAVLAAAYILEQQKNKQTLTNKHYIAKTIVTTEMLTALADHYGVRTYTNMLIGFKYIGKLIALKEDSDQQFLLGAEESYGLLKGAYARDKDGAVGALVLAEYAADLKRQDKTLVDALFDLFAAHGLYLERLDTILCPGASGFEQMQQVMRQLRISPPQSIGGHQVTAVLDYASSRRRDIANQSETTIDCDQGDVVTLVFGDERRRITIRPSGTEPKIKFYVQWYEPAENDVTSQYYELGRQLEGFSRELEGILLGSL